jgi:hypothetical protein
MSPARSRLPLALTLTALAALAAPAPAAPTVPTRDQIARWIKELGDDSFATREEASRKLWEAGRHAEDAVRAALDSPDVEVRRRAAEVYEKFKWGLYPDTPKDVAELIRRYQDADEAGRTAMLAELSPDKGAAGYRLLARVGRAETNPRLRAAFMNRLDGDLPRMARALADDADTLERLLQLGLEREPAPLVAHYADYWLRRGKLDERIAWHQPLANKDAGGRRQAAILAYLYRARGDLAKARSAAEVAGDGALSEALAVEAGDWKALAAKTEIDAPTPLEKLAYRAAYQRLAGKTKELGEARAEVKKFADDVKAPGEPLFQAAKVLFLEDAADDALAMLAHGDQVLIRFEILLARSRFKDALSIPLEDRKGELPDLEALEIRIARLRYQMGEKDKALEVLDRHARGIAANPNTTWPEELIDAEYRLGLTERADEHLAVLLRNRGPATWARLLNRAVPGKGEAATEWWGILREGADDAKLPAVVKQVRELLTGKTDARTVEELIARELKKEADKTKRAPEEADRHWLALAEAALAARDDKRALSLLENAQTAAGLTRLADYLAEKKEWTKASQRYAEAAKKAPDDPLPLLLSGWALTQGGKEKEGKALIDQAHALPLGDYRARHILATALVRRGLADEVQRETDWLLRLAPPRSLEHGEALRRRARAALARKDYRAAYEDQERAMLVIHSPRVRFLDVRRYVIEPALIHRLRAAVLLEDGKLDEAKREIALGLEATPGGLDLPIYLVPQMEKLGHKKEAAELYDKVRSVTEAACKDYPRFALAHNSAAWLSACCRRDLDAALEHAVKAVELDPDNSVHLDTLAEVHFQRGDKDKALTAIKKAVELTPQRDYYRKQLKRMEAGDRDAERPADE